MHPLGTLTQVYAYGHKGVIGGRMITYGRGTPVQHETRFDHQVVGREDGPGRRGPHDRDSITSE
jgi:hypothetical protein